MDYLKFPHLKIFESASERQILAALLVGEAIGEPYAGMLAIVGVLRNRADRGKKRLVKHWPDNIKDNCLLPYQFSCFYADYEKRKQDISTALWMDETDFDGKMQLILKAIDSQDGDRSFGADHYFNPKSCPIPEWASKMEPTVIVGNHHFYDSLGHKGS